MLSIGMLFPNMITVLSLCCGMSAIRYALDERWELSVSLIITSIILDGMDGRLARLLKATSNFGAQLDSLADFISFGVAPAMVTYKWMMSEIKGVGWGIAMFFAVCAALRLARFNTALPEDKSSKPEKFFTGIPSPAGAGLALVPMMVQFHFGQDATIPVSFMLLYVALVGLGMASRLPTFSLKSISIRQESALPIMLLAGLIIASLVTEPWLTLCAIGAMYVASIPVGVIMHRRTKSA